MRLGPLFLLPLLTLACAGPLTGATSFAPAYAWSNGPVPPAVPACSGPVVLSVADARSNPTEAGRRFEENKPNTDYPIEMTGSAAAWVLNGVEANLKRAGSPGTGTTAAALKITLVQLRLEERTYHNAEFSGDVQLDVVVGSTNPQIPCWRGQVSGSGANYGKAGNAENYQETLNRALEKATATLLAQKPFQDALCGKCSSL